MINGLSPNLTRTSPNEPPAERDTRLREAAREFESVFLGIILKEMRQSTQVGASEKPSFARETYDGWQDEMFARNMASGNGIGLAEVLYRQLQQQQLAKDPEQS